MKFDMGEVNFVAEAISELQACGSCAGATPTSEHCKACTEEAKVAIAALASYRAQQVSDLDFGQALAAMKAGKRVRRKKWLKGILSLSIQAGGLQLQLQEGKKQVWRQADHFHWFMADILATDWMVVE